MKAEREEAGEGDGEGVAVVVDGEAVEEVESGNFGIWDHVILR